MVVVVATAGTRGMKSVRERERKSVMRERVEGGPAAGVRYACASVDQVEEGARAGRVVERLGGLGGWPMAVVPGRW